MRASFEHLRFISAGAGSGKTYRLTQELEHAVTALGIAPGHIIATTFTVKAAGELEQRVRERLISAGRPALAEQMGQALIGTVHSVCQRLLQRFAFELGLAPELAVASLEDGGALFAQALDDVSSFAIAREMNALAERLDLYRPAPGEAPRSWRDDVRALASEARCNDIDAATLATMGPANADALLAYFPQPRAGEWDAELLTRVQAALDGIDVESDGTTATAKYLETLKGAIYRLRRPPARWSDWFKLSVATPAVRSDAYAEPVRAAAGAYAWHPRLHADLRAYIERCFSLSATALERFQSLKTERGLVDFTDMEQLMLHALELPPIARALREELDLLLVDEFQDTNPMQLAIFMKLASYAKHAVFVGDVKQAIYGFRGCDPGLVLATLDTLAARGSRAEALQSSWRSRPALVHYVNAVFGAAFAAELPREQIALVPERSEAAKEPALLLWTYEGNGSAGAVALADGVAKLVADSYAVIDSETAEPRPIRFGDIAVLAKTNEHVEEIARALRQAEIPIKMSLQGLLAVPELCLARACLRRLNDRSDTLASAEIVALASARAPEQWLADRLDWLAAGHEDYAWAEQSEPLLAALERLRTNIGTQSPVEIVARVLNATGIREVTTAWGPDAVKAAQRQRNLDALLELAVEYEDHCATQHLAATLTGLLFWLENPHSPELDRQPVLTAGDAVHVLTYHRAKGLEWPVVIATDLHGAWRSRLWNIRIAHKEGPFDLSAPLTGRVLRFWPPVFGNRVRGLPVLEAILDSEEGRRVAAEAAAESRRIAYVGLTRARDALVLVLPGYADGELRPLGPSTWLASFASPSLLPSGDVLTLPDGRAIPTRRQHLAPGGTVATPQRFQPRRLPARATRTPLPELMLPSAAPPAPTARLLEVAEIGERLALADTDMRAVGQALHAIIAAELVNPARPDACARAAALLAQHGVALDPAMALAAAQRFTRWLEIRFSPQRIAAEQPILHRRDDGRLVRGWIDVLVSTERGFVVIDHKSTPRPRPAWPQEIVDHGGQLALYRAALEAAGHSVAECWLHFPVAGAAIKIEL